MIEQRFHSNEPISNCHIIQFVDKVHEFRDRDTNKVAQNKSLF